MNNKTTYEIIVVGGGHAGCEAAAAAANLGGKVLFITMDLSKIAQMSCNPAMGGIAKGQIIREIDALGGYSGIITDKSSIQFRMLNKSKGPAMWSPRAQCDRGLYSKFWREELESNRNIDFWQDIVVNLIIRKKTVLGVKTRMGNTFYSKCVILTNGTFLNGLMHIGKIKIPGGRASDPASYGLSEQLIQQGLITGRMKTGTPPRIDGRSIDFNKFIKQEGDSVVGKFSFLNHGVNLETQKPCYIAYTNEDVHHVLKTGFSESPLFKGIIEGIGPRYCPSIEDKIVTFSDKNKHQLFLEPEGWDTCEYYVNGFSSSLPQDIQLNAMRRIPGLEKVRFFRPGYAIEYDYFPPTQLKYSLETKVIDNLFFAGQINGTTGYEEAAAQGLMAGINAFQKLSNHDIFFLKRDEAYIGILIDDLINKGVDEPYRMFTSRAEYRLLLRQDNADVRLTGISYNLGLASEERMKLIEKKNEFKELINSILYHQSVIPDKINPLLVMKSTSPVRQKVKLYEILLRPQIGIFDLDGLINFSKSINIPDSIKKDVLESVEIELKYQGYFKRERIMADKLQRLEHILIPPDFHYENIKSISTEGREKLKKVQPYTLGQASRISGVSPSDVSVLLMHLGR